MSLARPRPRPRPRPRTRPSPTTGWRALLALALLATAWLLLAPAPPEPPGPPGVSDKLAHVALFAVLGGVAALAFPGRPRWMLWGVLVAFGAAAEVAQGWVGRTPSVWDLGADAFGAAAAWLVPRGPRHRRGRRG